MPIIFPRIPARQGKKPPCNARQQRIETERERREAYGRQNVASALKLKGMFK